MVLLGRLRRGWEWPQSQARQINDVLKRAPPLPNRWNGCRPSSGSAWPSTRSANGTVKVSRHPHSSCGVRPHSDVGWNRRAIQNSRAYPSARSPPSCLFTPACRPAATVVTHSFPRILELFASQVSTGKAPPRLLSNGVVPRLLSNGVGGPEAGLSLEAPACKAGQGWCVVPQSVPSWCFGTLVFLDRRCAPGSRRSTRTT